MNHGLFTILLRTNTIQDNDFCPGNELKLLFTQTGLGEMGQKAQGCFEVFLANAYTFELNCNRICTLVLEVSAASIAGKLSWVSSGFVEVLS